MKLPNRQQAILPEMKITGYLLSPAHPYGRHKAAFFKSFGFTTEFWEELAAALLVHAEQNEVTQADDTRFGTRYNVEGELRTPDGRDPLIRVVWFIENGDNRPRLVTAYPITGSKDDQRT